MVSDGLISLFHLQLDEVDRSHLASRLALNFSGEYTDAAKLSDIPVTIIDVSVSSGSVC